MRLLTSCLAALSALRSLTERQQSIVAIAALTATGSLPRLHEALGQGLDRGLTISEEKEVLARLYA